MASSLNLRKASKLEFNAAIDSETAALLLIQFDENVSLMVHVKSDLCGLRPLRACENGRLRSLPSSAAGWLDSRTSQLPVADGLTSAAASFPARAKFISDT